MCSTLTIITEFELVAGLQIYRRQDAQPEPIGLPRTVTPNKFSVLELIWTGLGSFPRLPDTNEDTIGSLQPVLKACRLAQPGCGHAQAKAGQRRQRSRCGQRGQHLRCPFRPIGSARVPWLLSWMSRRTDRLRRSG